MPFNQPLTWVPSLADAIDRHPLVVPPTTPLIEAVALISQAHCQTCYLTDELAKSDPLFKEVRAGCVLVMDGQDLLGILTERDVVRLTVEGINISEALVAEVMVQPVITLPQQRTQDIFAALFLFRRYRIRHLPIVDDQEQLVGVISHESIRKTLRPANLLRFRRVADVMTTEVVHASLTTTIFQLAQLMAEYRVSCIVITLPNEEGDEQPVGIVTERDIVQFQTFQIDFRTTLAQTVMSEPLFLLSPEDSLWTAHQEMQKRRVGRLVVSWNWGQGLGIVTQTSLLKVFDPLEMYRVIENLQQTIQQLEAERLRSSNPPQPNLSLGNSDPQSQLETPISAPSLDRNADKREHLLNLLNSAQNNIQEINAHHDLPTEQRQLRLQSVLGILERLKREISY